MTKTNSSQKPYTLSLLGLAAFFLLGLWGFAGQATHLATSQPKPETSYETSKLDEVNNANIFFLTKTFLNRNKTFISIPFQFIGKPQILWLYLNTVEGTPRLSRLMYHPILQQLTWGKIQANGIVLYQKNNQYKTFEDFLNNPPPGNQILADPYLTVIPPFDRLKPTAMPSNSSDLDLNKVAYILTTYKPPRTENDVFYFEDTLDATSAQLNDKNDLVWMLSAPEASTENPFRLGGIHVDYR